jgi:hypothetical protein
MSFTVDFSLSSWYVKTNSCTGEVCQKKRLPTKKCPYKISALCRVGRSRKSQVFKSIYKFSIYLICLSLISITKKRIDKIRRNHFFDKCSYISFDTSVPAPPLWPNGQRSRLWRWRSGFDPRQLRKAHHV